MRVFDPLLRNAGLAAAVFVASMFASSNARAQIGSGFAVERFDPSERGSAWFAADSLDLRGHARPVVGVVATWAHRPLVIRDDDGSERALVDDQLVLHPGASVVLWERLRLAMSIPVAVVMKGTSATLAGAEYFAPDEGSMGDARIASDVRIAGTATDPFTLASGVVVYLPSGTRDAFTGDETVRIAPRLLAGGEVASFAWAVRIGAMVRPHVAEFGTTPIGTELTFAAAAGLHHGVWRVGPEIFGSTVTRAAFEKLTTPVEVLLGTHIDVAQEWRAGVAAGAGVARGLGAPDFRGVLSIEWLPD